MDPVAPQELSKFVNVVPGYPDVSTSKNLWLIICIQWFLCLAWSLFSSYFAYKKLYGDPEKSWKRVIQSINPILKRIQNLEKEKTIWYSYMEWIEEYCNVYYGLLNYTNMKVGDLEKLIKSPCGNLKNLTENPCWSKETIGDLKKDEKAVTDKEVISEEIWKDMTSLDDYQILTDFARVFQTLKTIQYGTESESTDVLDDGTRSFTMSDAPSTIETTDDYFRDELESYKESSDDEKLEFVTNKKAFHHLPVYYFWTSLMPPEQCGLSQEQSLSSVEDSTPILPSTSQAVQPDKLQQQSC